MTIPYVPPPLLYLLDTNILIHYARRNALSQSIEAQYRLLTTPIIPLISYVTEAELRSFAGSRQWGTSRLEQMNFILGPLRIVPTDQPGVIDAYIAIDIHSRSRGINMGKNDLWIAATARATSATLLTTNRDFDHLNGSFITREYIAVP